ncbi:MAG: selenocysteine-specific translation elongation factor [Thermodesulfobacteriota bacterium]|nr:selenocysteine-specific translation elongation factor [Thermodesulfobacteriota bacterium]
MKRIVIGTAGHVDHGKTSFIKALTGVDCDRLKEEKERGLTIELGFTSLGLPSGQIVSVVDVPGHIRFIRHMLSGASGIDLVVLVVAADEGVMPQTREHVQICELLGIDKGIVALTKTDLVDKDLLDLATQDVKGFLRDTLLRDAPIIPVSSVSGEGLGVFLDALDKMVDMVQERQTTGIPVLGVDRVFTMKGFGTVVTGTLLRGMFQHDQEVELLPTGKKARIRTLQVHSLEVENAMAGMRTAVNLQGLSVEDITRGNWLVPSGTFRPTRVIDARVNLLKKPGKAGIKMYLGTSETMGEISLHQVSEETVARIRLKEPVVAMYGDRFILRDISPQATIGGGEVLNPLPRRRFSSQVASLLMSGDICDRIDAIVRDAGIQGISKRDISARLAVKPGSMDKPLMDMLSRGRIVRFDAMNDLFVSSVYTDRLRDHLVSTMEGFHEKNPDAPGISREHLRSSFKGRLDPKLFHKVLQEGIKSGVFEEKGPIISKKGFSASLDKNLGQLDDMIYQRLVKAGFEPPNVKVLSADLLKDSREIIKVLGFMVRQGRIVKVKDDIYIADTHDNALKTRVRAFIQDNQDLGPADMKGICSVSRKYAIPYLEYLDRIRFTVRVGNVRKLGSKGTLSPVA